jgi:NodT family efflux transporter outer membrane factor (OMF) lipoprotein
MKLPLHTMAVIFLTLTLGLFTGCSLHTPADLVLNVEIPNVFEQAPVRMLPGPQEQWWLTFGDQRLNALMGAAFSGNLDLEQAYARLSQADAVARKSGAALSPTLNLNGKAGRSRQLGGFDTVTGGNHELSLSAGYEVDLWNRLRSQKKANELARTATLEEIRTLYLSISANVADLYYLMVEQRAQLDLTDQTIQAIKATLELVEQRFREGMVPSLDLYQARQNLASAWSQRPDFEARLTTTAHALSLLSGGYPNSNLGGTLAILPDLPSAFPGGLPSELLKKRPDIRGELLRLKAADLSIGVAVANRFPSVNLMAALGRGGSDFGNTLSGVVWNLAGNLAAPLVDGGNRRAEVDRTRAVYDERLAGYRKTVIIAFQEVEDALVKNRTTAEKIQRLKNEETVAGATLRLSKDRYFDGISDYLPVLTAQSAQYNTQSRLLAARRELIANRISLARAMGGNWMDTEVSKRLTDRNPDTVNTPDTASKSSK